MFAMTVAGSNDLLIHLRNPGVIELTGQTDLCKQIVGADVHDVDTFSRRNLVDIVDSLRSLNHDGNENVFIVQARSFSRRQWPEVEMRKTRGHRAMTDWRIFARVHGASGFSGIIHMWHDDAHRTAIKHTTRLPVIMSDNAHDRCNATVQGSYRHIDHAFERQTAVFHINEKKIVIACLGDLRGIRCAQQSNAQAEYQLVSSKFVFYVVAILLHEVTPGVQS